jgi:catechol 2,3-dioxygenase-like lactoylglutathione lyase family enzyme
MKPANTPVIRKLHHSALRCSDSGRTRQFYEDFLGLPLAASLELSETATGRAVRFLHTFYRLGDGSFLAFFEVPGAPFVFKAQHDFDLHIALEVNALDLEAMVSKGRSLGVETRGITEHEFIRSAYFRDPDGYVVELAAKLAGHDAALDPAANRARDVLERWQGWKGALLHGTL